MGPTQQQQATPAARPQYDLLLRGGHLIDPRNGINGTRDLAIRDGKVAAVAERIDPSQALKTVDLAGLFVTPGLIDIHVHVFAGTGERRSYAGDNSVYPDGFTFRAGVTAVADAGCSGWRNFADFKRLVIDRSRTRVFAFLNIVGHGMRGSRYEQDVADMQAEPTAEMAMRHKGVIVGIKTAHFMGRDFTGVDRAVAAGTRAGIPVMVDFGRVYPEKSLAELLTHRLRPGDIYTHVYSGLRGELDPSGHAHPALQKGRERGVIFDVGHGGGSFTWRVAVPIVQEGFLPDSISTDLHAGDMNTGVKDMLSVMSKFLALGMPLDRLIQCSTWNPAREIHQEQIGHLSVGAAGRRGGPAGRAGRFRLHGRLWRPPQGPRAAELRDDASRWQGRLRAERPVAARLGDAAEGLQGDGQPALGRQSRFQRRLGPTAAWRRGARGGRAGHRRRYSPGGTLADDSCTRRASARRVTDDGPDSWR